MALINCPNCGATISDKAEKCVKCGGLIRGAHTSGLTLQDDSPVFGETGNLTNTGNLISAMNTGALTQNTGVAAQSSDVKKSKKKLIGILVGGIAVAAIVIVVLMLNKKKEPEDIQLSKHSATVDVDSSIKLDYFISPDEASDAEVVWISSNEKVATVVNGNVTGVSEGDCEITVKTKNGKKDLCVLVVEPAKPDFSSLYNKYCRSSWATLSSDASTLTVDTNPYDIDDYYESAAWDAIEVLNREMGFSDSLLERMGGTRALDGTQTSDNKVVDVSWTYHPDKGLRVVYSLKY